MSALERSDLPEGQQSKESVAKIEARVRADVAEEIARARAQALMDARDDLARTAERLERKGREPGGRQQLGTAAGVRLACFRLIELADAAQKDAGKGFPSSPAALPDQAGTREHPEDRDAR